MSDVDTHVETNRWRGVTGLAFLAAAVGIIGTVPASLLVAVVGVAYGAYTQPVEAPDPDLEVGRAIEDTTPEFEEEVEVEVTVANAGDEILPDVRWVDGVPAVLEVVEGSPRAASTLRPGESFSLSYTVEARRGHHEFGESTVVARNWSGTAEREQRLVVEDSIECIPRLKEDLEEFPLRKQTVEHAGRVTTDTGGSGIEFHSTREYQHGDPLPRIDWNRRAKTGEFTTIQFREERAATVALVVDTRREAYVTDSEGVSAVEHAIGAARSIGPALMDAGNSVGVGSFGPVWSWVNPSLGRSHRVRVREELAVGEGFSPLPADQRYKPRHTIRRLRNHLPGDAQVVFLSPVADDYLVTTLRRIEAYGHDVTLVSPDVTDESTPGGRVASMERGERLRAVRRSGVRVVDWPVDQPVGISIANAQRRWSR